MSMLSIFMVYFSKRQNMFIPFLVFDGMIIFQTALNLPTILKGFVYLRCYFFLCLGYCIIIYYNKPIYSYVFEYESNKARITERQRRAVKVSKN
ncbi:hypothetical protein TUBRATIS_17060 [Tubulinosema ratisbonensis]|uniref:Uncharacterized protein n=1 Tax=Tubulinosema ratisbonensis TaxID=291195 RepID=A0A437AL40_9MICR|nr:hypothetical protein TUBRATIS_17060 [Tubulinosema ratisbonensis]